MASLGMGLAGAVALRSKVKVNATASSRSAGGGGGGSEEKGLLDWILGGMQRDQLVETDPVLKKVEDKNGTRGTTSVSVPNKKPAGGFGGLFAKK